MGLALVASVACAHARLSASLLAVAIVAVGVALALVASSSVSLLAVVLGAVGALVGAWVAPWAPVLAGAVLVTAAFAARGVRASTPRRRWLHAGLSIAGGLAGSLCAVSYARSTLTGQLAAVVVAGLLASAALLVPVEDPLAFDLGIAAEEVTGAARVHLARAAFFARLGADLREVLAPDVRRQLDRSLRALITLGQARARAHVPATTGVIDRQMGAHVSEIERLLSAATEADARSAGMSDTTLAAIRASGDQLEAQATALAEVDAALPPGPGA
jgi:xanthosine utilization system XapX-like protein